MAGARIELTADVKQAGAALQRAGEALDTSGQTLLLQDIGEYLLRSTRDRAATEQGPDGEPWPALSPRYAARKARKRPGLPMLTFDGHLLGDRLAWQVAAPELLVGTSAPQGAALHFGRPEINLPARPWLGISDQDAEEIVQLTQDHLVAALSGSRA